MKKTFVAIIILAFFMGMLAGCGSGGGLKGRFVEDGSDYEYADVYEFSGKSFTNSFLVYLSSEDRILSDGYITKAEWDSAEVVSGYRDDYKYIHAKGTFSINKTGDKIEFIYDGGYVRVLDFSQTENTIKLGYDMQYIREDIKKSRATQTTVADNDNNDYVEYSDYIADEPKTDEPPVGYVAGEAEESIQMLDEYNDANIADEKSPDDNYNPPPLINCNGMVFTIATVEGLQAPVEEIGDPIEDYFYARDRWVEARININIVYELFSDEASVLQAVRTDYSSGAGKYDLVLLPVSALASFSQESLFVNLYDVPYVKDGLKCSWWNQDFIKEMTTDGMLFYAASDITDADNLLIKRLIYAIPVSNGKLDETGVAMELYAYLSFCNPYSS